MSTEQLTREQVAQMPYTEVAEAVRAGQCDVILGRAEQGTVPAPEAATANADGGDGNTRDQGEPVSVPGPVYVSGGGA